MASGILALENCGKGVCSRCSMAVGRRAAGFSSRGDMYLQTGKEEGGARWPSRGFRDSVQGIRVVSWLGIVVFEGTGSCPGGGRSTNPSGGASQATMSVFWLGIGINGWSATSSGGEHCRS